MSVCKVGKSIVLAVIERRQGVDVNEGVFKGGWENGDSGLEEGEERGGEGEADSDGKVRLSSGQV